MSSAIYRVQCGAYLIEAGARDLGEGVRWQPWVRLALTRRGDGVYASRTFDRLKPVFGTREAALHYAAELGRSLVDTDSELCPAWGAHADATGPSSGLNFGAAADDAEPDSNARTFKRSCGAAFTRPAH